MSMWNYGTDVMDALMEFVISLVCGCSATIFSILVISLCWSWLFSYAVGYIQWAVCWFVLGNACEQFYASWVLHIIVESVTWYSTEGSSYWPCPFDINVHCQVSSSHALETWENNNGEDATHFHKGTSKWRFILSLQRKFFHYVAYCKCSNPTGICLN